MYYNTTSEKGETLKEFKEKAKSQDEKILEYFKSQTEFYKSRGYGEFQTSSSRLYKFLFLEKSPITSIRRAVNTLVNKGELIYTDKKVLGLYGRNELLIKLNK